MYNWPPFGQHGDCLIALGKWRVPFTKELIQSGWLAEVLDYRPETCLVRRLRVGKNGWRRGIRDRMETRGWLKEDRQDHQWSALCVAIISQLHVFSPHRVMTYSWYVMSAVIRLFNKERTSMIMRPQWKTCQRGQIGCGWYLSVSTRLRRWGCILVSISHTTEPLTKSRLGRSTVSSPNDNEWIGADLLSSKNCRPIEFLSCPWELLLMCTAFCMIRRWFALAVNWSLISIRVNTTQVIPAPH